MYKPCNSYVFFPQLLKGRKIDSFCFISFPFLYSSSGRSTNESSGDYKNGKAEKKRKHMLWVIYIVDKKPLSH